MLFCEISLTYNLRESISTVAHGETCDDKLHARRTRTGAPELAAAAAERRFAKKTGLLKIRWSNDEQVVSVRGTGT